MTCTTSAHGSNNTPVSATVNQGEANGRPYVGQCSRIAVHTVHEPIARSGVTMFSSLRFLQYNDTDRTRLRSTLCSAVSNAAEFLHYKYTVT